MIAYAQQLNDTVRAAPQTFHRYSIGFINRHADKLIDEMLLEYRYQRRHFLQRAGSLDRDQ